MRLPRLPILAAALIASVAEPRAQEVTIDHFIGLGAGAMGMGAAFNAVADDGTALFWNPAGLGQIRRIELGLSLARPSRSTDATLRSASFGPTTTGASVARLRLSRLALAVPVPTYRGSLVFAAGFHRVQVFDGLLRVRGFSDAEELGIWGDIDERGALGMFSLGGAVQVTPHIMLGSSLNVWRGDYALRGRDIRVDSLDRRPEFASDYGRLFVDDRYWGPNATLGLLAAPGSGIRLGLRLATPFALRVTEHFADEIVEEPEAVVTPGVFAFKPDPRRTRVRYKVRLPFRFGVGAAWTWADLLLAAAATYVDWREAEYNMPELFGIDNSFFRTEYRDVWSTHLGAQYRIPRSTLRLRAGFYTDPLPFVGRRPPIQGEDDPRVEAERDRRFFTFGAGAVFEGALAVDVAWVRGHLTRREGNLLEEVSLGRLFLETSYRY